MNKEYGFYCSECLCLDSDAECCDKFGLSLRKENEKASKRFVKCDKCLLNIAIALRVPPRETSKQKLARLQNN